MGLELVAVANGKRRNADECQSPADQSQPDHQRVSLAGGVGRHASGNTGNGQEAECKAQQEPANIAVIAEFRGIDECQDQAAQHCGSQPELGPPGGVHEAQRIWVNQ